MELSLIGLQNAGKSSLVNVLTTGSFHEDMIPTVSSTTRASVSSHLTLSQPLRSERDILLMDVSAIHPAACTAAI